MNELCFLWLQANWFVSKLSTILVDILLKVSGIVTAVASEKISLKKC